MGIRRTTWGSLCAAALSASSVGAQDAIPPSDVMTLSPQDREAALEAGARRAPAELPINGLSRGVHGEIGTSFDSRGGHAVYGTGRVPLGQNGAASFSFLDADFGRERYRR